MLTRQQKTQENGTVTTPLSVCCRGRAGLKQTGSTSSPGLHWRDPQDGRHSCKWPVHALKRALWYICEFMVTGKEMGSFPSKMLQQLRRAVPQAPLGLWVLPSQWLRKSHWLDSDNALCKFYVWCCNPLIQLYLHVQWVSVRVVNFRYRWLNPVLGRLGFKNHYTQETLVLNSHPGVLDID